MDADGNQNADEDSYVSQDNPLEVTKDVLLEPRNLRVTPQKIGYLAFLGAKKGNTMSVIFRTS